MRLRAEAKRVVSEAAEAGVAAQDSDLMVAMVAMVYWWTHSCIEKTHRTGYSTRHTDCRTQGPSGSAHRSN